MPPVDYESTRTPYEPSPAESARAEAIFSVLSGRIDRMEARHADKPADNGSSGANSDN